MPNEHHDHPLRQPRYGVDAPAFPALTGAVGAACCLAAARWRPAWRGRAAVAAVGSAVLASTGVYLHTTLHGKLSIWERELDRIELQGDERLLDLGCGRGAVLIQAARRLPRGQAHGVDLWSGKDQSGNNPEATRDNAAAGGVADRVELHTADMTALPFEDGSFDVVTSALAIHNIPTRGARHRAVDEAMRVLRPGGLLVVADFWWAVKEYAAHLDRARPGHPDSGAGRQPTTVRPLGPGYWYGGPWFAVSLLRAVKESPTAAA